MNALLKLMRYRQFLGQGGGSSPVDFLAIKESITEYRNDEITEVPDYMFAGCKNLKHVTFPATARYYASSYVFAGCDSLAVIDFLGTPSGLSTTPVDDNGSVACAALVIRGEPFSCETDMEIEQHPNIYLPRVYAENILGAFDEESGDYEYPYGWSWAYANVFPLEDYTVDGTITGELDLAKMGIEL